jgi:hypothetical protein
MRWTTSRGFEKAAVTRQLAALVTLGLVPAPARAELLYFAKGGQVQAPAQVEAERVKIELPGGIHEFLREDFRKIEPGYSPDREWAGRRRQALAKGFPERYDALWWALENGLAEEASQEVRALHKIDPNHAPTSRMNSALDRLDRPTADPEFSAFRRALGGSMTVARSPHILLLHQRPQAEADSRTAMLEHVLTSYYLFFAAQGLELKVPERRFIFAWFDDQPEYLAFLRSQNAAAFATTKGYFHPTWNAVVTYDGRNSDKQREGREGIVARREELGKFQELVDKLPARAKLRITLIGETSRTLGKAAAQALAERLQREIRREELLLELDWRAVDEGTAAHEMIHLLAANSGLLPRHDAFPVWLQEGIAMQFEVVRSGRWSGIGRANDLRLPDWRRIQPTPLLEPLVRDLGYGRGYQRDLYAQSWSLVYFLRSREPVRFLTFLDLLRSSDETLSELSPSDRWIAAFRRAFGTDLDALEHEWFDFMSTVRTPLERHAPQAADPSPKPAARPALSRGSSPGRIKN